MRDTEEVLFQDRIIYYRPDRRILQIGNSLGVTIPNEFVREFKLVPGQMMKIIQNADGKLVLEPGMRPDAWNEQYRRRK